MTDSRIAPTDLPTVEIVYFDGFDELDAVGPHEVLAAAGFPVRAVGFPAGTTTVRGGNGLTVGVDGSIGDAPGLLVLPGGGGWATDRPGVAALIAHGALPATVARLHAAGTTIATVCTGALLAGAAGILRGRPAVTNRLALEPLRALGADVRAEARVVDTGDVVTSGGPLAGIDMAIRLVERFCGDDAADQAAARIEHERRGPLVLEPAAV